MGTIIIHDRRDQERKSGRDALIEALVEGEASGISPRAVPEIFEEARRELQRRGG